MARTDTQSSPPPTPASTEETIDLGATLRELSRAFAPPPEVARKVFFEIERDVAKAGGILKQLLCDEDGPERVKETILTALADDEKKR